MEMVVVLLALVASDDGFLELRDASTGGHTIAFGFTYSTLRQSRRAAWLVSAVALGAPELEAPPRGVEIARKLAANRRDLVAEPEHLVVEQTLAVTHVLVLLRPLNGSSAV